MSIGYLSDQFNDDTRTNMIVGIIIALIVAFFVTDCAEGTNGSAPGTVRGHEYHPPYTSIMCTSNGKTTSCYPVYHPEEFHLAVDVPTHGYVDVQTTHGQYYAIKDNVSVTVTYREGKWTHHWYNADAQLAEKW